MKLETNINRKSWWYEKFILWKDDYNSDVSSLATQEKREKTQITNNSNESVTNIIKSMNIKIKILWMISCPQVW